MNRELLDRIIAEIEAEPERLNMASMVSLTPDDDSAPVRSQNYRPIYDGWEVGQVAGFAQDCKTAGCVAGWAVMLTAIDGKTDQIVRHSFGNLVDFETSARDLLDLNHDAAEELFFGCAGVEDPDKMLEILRGIAAIDDDGREVLDDDVRRLRRLALGF